MSTESLNQTESTHTKYMHVSQSEFELKPRDFLLNLKFYSKMKENLAETKKKRIESMFAEFIRHTDLKTVKKMIGKESDCKELFALLDTFLKVFMNEVKFG